MMALIESGDEVIILPLLAELSRNGEASRWSASDFQTDASTAYKITADQLARLLNTKLFYLNSSNPTVLFTHQRR